MLYVKSSFGKAGPPPVFRRGPPLPSGLRPCARALGAHLLDYSNSEVWLLKTTKGASLRRACASSRARKNSKPRPQHKEKHKTEIETLLQLSTG